MPGNTISGWTTCESVGQNSGLFSHSVRDNSGQAPLRIAQSVPFAFTIVVHFGHRVCIADAPRSLGARVRASPDTNLTGPVVAGRYPVLGLPVFPLGKTQRRVRALRQ